MLTNTVEVQPIAGALALELAFHLEPALNFTQGVSCRRQAIHRWHSQHHGVAVDARRIRAGLFVEEAAGFVTGVARP